MSIKKIIKFRLMKKSILQILVILSFVFSCKAQTYPLRTYIDIPENAYLKDTNNELNDYVGTWKGNWDNKTIYMTFKKITNKYDDVMKYYADFLIGKFKVTTSNNQLILFDNTMVTDADAKIEGGKFRKKDDKYSFIYSDDDLCGMNGYIIINFTDSTKTKLNWLFSDMTDIITSDCPYYDSPVFPQPLPKEIILIKQ